MKPPPAAWSAFRQAPGPAGVRLLARRGDPSQLRWSPDPDGPGLRHLRPGEVRLAIVSLQLGAGVWLNGAAWSAGDGLDSAWTGFLARGEAVVVESAHGGALPGMSVRGCVPISSHLVVSEWGTAWSPAALPRSAVPRDLRVRPSSGAVVTTALARLGLDDVEQRVRRRVDLLGRRGVQGVSKWAAAGLSRPGSWVPISEAR